MASRMFSSIQSLSTNLLHAIRGTPSTSHQQQDPPSPVTDQQKSVRENLEKLSQMLARIKAVQQDAEEREIYDRSVHLWLAELKGVAYQAEDVLDEFYYEVLRSIIDSGDAAIEAYHRDGGIKRKFDEMYTPSSLTSKVSIPDGMAEKIKDITERFAEISNARKDLHLREEDATRLVIGPQMRSPTSSHVDKRAIFGREEEKEKIISLLNPENGPDFMVLPIVGMGGFGKTTLAQLVYNDSRLRGLFNKRCWVSVSEDFDVVRLTKTIVELVSKRPYEFSELSILQDVLKEKIRGLGLFLVLDDVWNEKGNLWECFLVGFLGAKFVRILTTTRNTSVAKIMQTTSPFKLGSLPEENCWPLFKHFTFGDRETSENANLHEIGRGIVKKCKGSPLAIKALGGILRYETDEEKWREILESDISEIDETGEVMPALRLSFQKLPQHLKPCFLYLSMFPKDIPFKQDMVVRLWMAQGYINGNTKNLKTLEEIGSEYFDELQGRSLVQRTLVNHGLFTTHFSFDDVYCLHDLIHDLARSISQEAYGPVSENDQQCSGPCKVYHLYLDEQDKLLGSSLAPSYYGSIRTIVKECSTQIFDDAIFSEIGCMRGLHLRYSLFQNTFGMFQNIFGMWKHLRYLFLEHSKMETLPDTVCRLYNLQTLDLKTSSLQKLPENIKNLINLQYFQLNSRKIQELPASFFLLRNLLTLLLRSCVKLKELPRGIEQLTRLRRLKLPESLLYIPSGIAKLTTLEPLSGNFRVMEHGIGGLGELKDMNKLSGLLFISGLINIGDVEDSTNANLASKPNLSSLNLDFQEDPWSPIKRARAKPEPGMMKNLQLDVQSSTNARNKNRIRRGIASEKPEKMKNLQLDVQSSTNTKNKNDEKIQEVVLQSLQPAKNKNDEKIQEVVLQSLQPAKNKNDEKIQEVVLQSLQPHGNLEVLEIYNYGGRIFPSWLLTPLFPKLKILILNFCTEPNFIPPFGQLSCLEILDISGNTEVRNGGDELSTYSLLTEYGRSKQPKEPSYPSLKALSLKNLLNLVDWQAHDGDFPCLENLTIENCPKLGKIGIIPQQVREVTFENCPKLKLLTCPSVIKELMINKCGFREIMFGSVSESLKISNCAELISIDWMTGGLNSVREVSFEYCPKLESLTIPVGTLKLKIHECGFWKIRLWSVYENLTISNCIDLISINWMRDGLNYARVVSSEYCPKLEHVPVTDVLHSMIQRADICDCPRLYLGKRYVYQRDSRIQELNLCGNNEIHLSDSTIPLLENHFSLFLTKEDFREVESLTCAPSFGMSCQCIMLNMASLVILEIYRCIKVISVTGLDNLSNLKCVTISYCPELCNWNDKTLPLSLKFLELDSCDKVSSLPLLSVQSHLSTLKVLVIKKCPRLAVLEGFHGLMKLKNVELLHCRNISISPESLQFRPHIIIGNCPLMRDWCQRNWITYYEVKMNPIGNPQDDEEAEQEGGGATTKD